MLLTDHPNQFPHTLIPASVSPHCSVNLVKYSWCSFQAEAQVSQLLQGSFATGFQQGDQVEDPDHGGSATQRHLQHCGYECACLA